MELETGARIIDAIAGPAVPALSVPSLVLYGNTGIGTIAAPFEVAPATNVQAVNTLSGDIAVASTGTMTVENIDPDIGSGDPAVQNQGPGNVYLITGGLMTVAGPVDALTAGQFVEFNSTGGVTELPGYYVTAHGLLLLGSGTFDLAQTNYLANGANPGVVAANVTGSVDLDNTAYLGVGIVAGVSGIATNGGDVTIDVSGANILAVPNSAGFNGINTVGTTTDGSVTLRADSMNVGLSTGNVIIDAGTTGTVLLTPDSTSRPVTFDATAVLGGSSLSLTSALNWTRSRPVSCGLAR